MCSQTLRQKQKHLHLCRHSLHRCLRNPCSMPVHRTDKNCHIGFTNHHSRRKKNYSQLDLEATAIDVGLHQILAGGPQVTGVTDQQRLQSPWRSKRKPSARIESSYITKTSTTVSYKKKRER